MGWDDKRPAVRAKPVTEASVRIFDFAAALFLLLLLTPLIVLITIGILIDSRGPILYGCTRVGRYGNTFRMLKFRKMNAQAQGPPLTVASDTRFTRFGRLLARTKLDEVPQLWNVVRGDMSLVGPRPEDIAFVSLLRNDYEEILTVPPGITGLSQLAFAKESQLLAAEDSHDYYIERLLPQKVELDRLYARRRSLLFNLQVLLWTAVVVGLIGDVAVNRATGRATLRRRPRQAELAPEPTPAQLGHEVGTQ
ncbi:MAG TPA: sugar transferase [Gaiellaceae bacterium]|jgi:lipopolysaccharide/colanic/teichoic acid biosynthesis glycosyltransferase